MPPGTDVVVVFNEIGQPLQLKFHRNQFPRNFLSRCYEDVSHLLRGSRVCRTRKFRQVTDLLRRSYDKVTRKLFLWNPAYNSRSFSLARSVTLYGKTCEIKVKVTRNRRDACNQGRRSLWDRGDVPQHFRSDVV